MMTIVLYFASTVSDLLTVLLKKGILSHFLALLRHMLYLGVVLLLTFLCYCSGLYLAWRRRDKFKSYENILEEEIQNKPYYYKSKKHENEKTKVHNAIEAQTTSEPEETKTADNSKNENTSSSVSRYSTASAAMKFGDPSTFLFSKLFQAEFENLEITKLN